MSAILDVIQFSVMLVLVRILTPADYGAYGLIMAVMGFAFVFSSQSFVDYLLQIRGDTGVDYSLYFTLSLLINSLLFLVFN
ncbi:MAG: oligosaccharide flippase family protein, partial [Proteobacteria bacterium]|nr:oligosaccharide flippase family protein [Pseudomonadota bacterium]